MVELRELFTMTRFPPGAMFVFMMLYFPVGVFLIVCRIIIMLHVYMIVGLLPKASARRQFMRAMLGVVGIHIWLDDDKTDPERLPKLLVSNCTSVLDHVIIDAVVNNIVPYSLGIPAIFHRLLGYRDLGASAGKQQFMRNIKAFCQDSEVPVLLQPEETATNNTTGLLKFSSLAFELELPIQPVALQVSRLSFPCALTTIESPRWTDVCWCFFSPVTVFRLKLLPVEMKGEEEKAEDFGERIRGLIAESLNLPITDFTAADKAELIKKLKTPPPVKKSATKYLNNGREVESTTSFIDSLDAELRTMIQQVKDVMPQVPIYAVKQDLEQTKDVDTTISNILEGRVEYSNEAKSESRSQPPDNQMQEALFKADSFSRKPYDRHLSLAERKQAMLEMARYRYKQKHGLL